MESLCAKFSSQAVFVAVYICEAHASDEWPVGATISRATQPKTIKDRLQLALQFKSEKRLTLPLFIDTTDNQFQKEYSAWPFRYYVIQGNRLFFKAEPDVISLRYDISELFDILPNCLASS